MTNPSFCDATQDKRGDERCAFLAKHLPQATTTALAGDASFRRYFRINEHPYLLMDAPPPEDIRPFVKMAMLLAPSVHVPHLIAQDVDNGFLLLQDFGQTEFADVIKTQHKEHWYQKALRVLVDLQQIVPTAVEDYGDKYHLEMDLFSEWFLPDIGAKIDQDLWQSFKDELVKSINEQPKVLVHRDYHSRNLMIDGDKIGVIDFQDAQVGAYTYDLVSLVRDAYIDESEDWVFKKIQTFYELRQPKVSLQEFTAQANIMGVQRNLKVLGIFVRLSKRDGKDRYLANIPKVMRDLLAQLSWLDTHGYGQIYGDFLRFLHSILPQYEQKFGACHA